MQHLKLVSVGFLFLLSGAAALIYQVVWVRSLALVFGGTHLAVTTVLAVFMAGLALGSWLIGKRVDTQRRPLRVYGVLEIGIALSALLAVRLISGFPSLYAALAPGRDTDPLLLTLLRVLLSAAALIVPTTLMGGTLPVLAAFAARSASSLGARLSLLYGVNTLGAAAGAAVAGFYLLPFHGVTVALAAAVAVNVAAGAGALLLALRVPDAALSAPEPDPAPRDGREVPDGKRNAAAMFVLIGAGVSGFCALSYEVLWTRVLTMIIGTSVYGFTIMLIAFLTGIAGGSQLYTMLAARLAASRTGLRLMIGLFGVVQVLIGVSAFFVSLHIRDLPLHALVLRGWIASLGMDSFQARQWANLFIAFSVMLVPALCMGFAFPLAGDIIARARNEVGRAVGAVLSVNTIGAILGAAASGFLLIYLFGVERSLQMIMAINAAWGLLVVARLHRSPAPAAAVGAVSLAVLLFLAFDSGSLRIWDAKFFAVFRNNQPEAFDTRDKIRDAVENTRVLFSDEGVNATISVIKVRGGGDQALLVNGKVVASNTPQDRQCQLTLGHLPLLLHRDPKKVLVVGLGTGMTLGAVSVHQRVEELTLVEMEPHVLPAARTFGAYNHQVLDDPKLRIVINDGRNHLLTTTDRYDVITADPIHPWTQGSGYLYTSEYFKLAAERLRPGGIMCQWLPIYEMQVEDLRSVAATFASRFRYTLAWLTHYDAELIGSNEPILLDEQVLARRIAEPAVAADLAQVMMGTPRDLLSFFLMGTAGLERFAAGGTVNTDDNLKLEFSAPLSIADRSVVGRNVASLQPYRENVLAYLEPAKERDERSAQVRRWTEMQRPLQLAGMAHALYLSGERSSRGFRLAAAELERAAPGLATWRFLRDLQLARVLPDPTPIGSARLTMLLDSGFTSDVEVSAVLVPVTEERSSIMFVDNGRKAIYGQRYLSGPDRAERAQQLAAQVLQDLRDGYSLVSLREREAGYLLPREGTVLLLIERTVNRSVRSEDGS